jgi:ribosome-associated protein
MEGSRHKENYHSSSIVGNFRAPVTERPAAEDAPPISKTRRKKDMHALQALGEALVALTPEQLSGLPLPEQLADAIAAARRIPTFEARRRQMQYIGRLMREVDPEPIAERLARLRHAQQRDNTLHQEAERWRSRLLAEDGALTELAARHPGVDTQHLHQLVRNARREAAHSAPPKSHRALFRALREFLAAASHGETKAPEGG